MSLQHPDDDQRIAYALDELEPHDRGVIRAHLDGCDLCAGEVEQLAQAIDSGRPLGRGTAPLHVLVALLGNQARAQRRDATRRMVARLSAAAALGGLLFIGGYWQGRQALVRRSVDRVALEQRAPFQPLPPLPLATDLRAATSADYLSYVPHSESKGERRTQGDSL